MNLSNIFSNTRNYAPTSRFCWPCKETSVHAGGVWSKSSISQEIVPWNRNSKSLQGKQFINVCWRSNIVGGTFSWSKLIQLGVLLPFFCHLMSEHFHTLKFESDFFSRQGHWTLYSTGVYDGILLREKQRRSCFSFFRTMNRLALE